MNSGRRIKFKFHFFCCFRHFSHATKSDYNDIYAIEDNTTLENYELLKRMSKSVDDKLTTAIVVTSITSALLIYTAVDAIWLHLAFPVKVQAACYDNNPGVLLTYNY